MRFTGSKAGEAGAYLASLRLQFGRCIVENFRGQNTKYNDQGDLIIEVIIQFRLLCVYREAILRSKGAWP